MMEDERVRTSVAKKSAALKTCKCVKFLLLRKTTNLGRKALELRRQCLAALLLRNGSVGQVLFRSTPWSGFLGAALCSALLIFLRCKEVLLFLRENRILRSPFDSGYRMEG